ncbi:conserved Plasmodium protein, unknown function [Plasmodium berghei]|uniref:Uncharacterized protein n=2 Tax=Plasmodium berghei TaxID=5821 RepID=A0A509AFC7_PLABA|nr:conserved Plasmodium protein, unknown function [Plasmodium berghei ANKA]CXI00085.1 conserved Plasmodium protein, unknown function [Plasmodium berghei]SCL91643.1 conserved Plasmodium protein, unknown function [Plasmodium berghei]SCM15504.1 conserved Plasmodium protein, unknown function [Plasmodium berghei]SCM17296.1 conserved Plasmodium protein, unknown function [Plasmodium berghei]SCN22478.1 conserved Plasmodium protein, unknown function [Plasmodium berghei]|eukprot:XP_034420102.1 conserved Plasmodium protein, unknown function [Plasmodium berghei ANKA]
MNFLRLLTNEKPKSDEENVNNIDESNKMAILKDYVQPNENDKTVDPEEDLDDDKEIKTNENINDDVVKNEISNDSSIVDNNIKEKCESENGINDEQKLIKYNISTFPDNKNLKKNNYDKLITENYKTNNRHIGDKRKLNNAYVDHNNEEKLSEDDEEKEFEYYYKKTIDFINTEFFGKNDELKDILNTPESDSKSLSEIDQMNIIHTNNLPDKYILEKMPFCKLINFEKNISTERQRVLNYYNEDRKQIYESSINKERQFSHIFQNTEKYYDAKEILAFLLPYHTFYLDHINIDEDDEDIELINNTEKEIKEIEQSVEEIKQSFVAYANPSIIWSLSRIVDRANHQYKKCRKM